MSSNTPTPESKSPVRLTLCILGIVFVLFIGGYMARETLLAGMLKVGIYSHIPAITNLAAGCLEEVSGMEIWQKFIEGDDKVLANYAWIHVHGEDIWVDVFVDDEEFRIWEDADEDTLVNYDW